MRKWIGSVGLLILAMAWTAPALAGETQKQQGIAFKWGVGFNSFYNEGNVEGYSTVFKLAIQPSGNFDVAFFNESAEVSIDGGLGGDSSGDIRLTGIELTYKHKYVDWTLTIGGATCTILGPGGNIRDVSPFADIGVTWKMMQSEAEGVKVEVNLSLKHRFLDIATAAIGAEEIKDLHAIQAVLSFSLVF